MARHGTKVTGAIAAVCVLLVAVLAAFLVMTPPPPSAPPSKLTVITPIYLTATPGPPAVRALEQWSGRGSGLTTRLNLAGAYSLAWSVDNTLAQGVWRFEVNYMGAAWEGFGLSDIVDFQHQATQRPGPVSDVALLAPVPDGSYYFDVVTCQFCTWQLTLRKR